MRPGVEVKDRGFGAFMERMRQAARESGTVRIGVFDPGDRGDGVSNVELAAIQEFGTKDGRIPERSFLRACMDANRQKYLELEKRLLGLVSDGRMVVEKAAALLGARAAADVKAWIVAQRGFQGLAESTLAARKRAGFRGTKALIRTAELLNSITWQAAP